MIHAFFNLIVKQHSITPSSWKKGDDHGDLQKKRPDEARTRSPNLFPPIAIQHFSPRCSTTDFSPISTATNSRLLRPKAQNPELTCGWRLSTFDSTQHGAIWRSLRNHSVSEQYICLLKKLYADKRATVLTDVESDEFEIASGTKQGDLVSSLLSTRNSNQQWRRTLVLGTKRIWASNWETRKECTNPTYALPTTCS